VPLPEAVLLHAGDTKKDKPSMIEVLITTVLKNPYIWGMALTYFFIYVIRQGVTSW
jgi:MFS transporter, OPA family, sugar phosphate sensor protein UhpC